MVTTETVWPAKLKLLTILIVIYKIFTIELLLDIYYLIKSCVFSVCSLAILLMKTRGLREVRVLAHIHPACEWQRQAARRLLWAR